MENITETISLLDELRGKWNKLLEEGKTEPEWKRRVTIKFTDKLNNKELCGLDLKVAGFLGDVMVAIPKLFDGHEALRKAALDGERYRKAGTELAEAIKEIQNRYTSTIGSSVSGKYVDIECALRAYRQAVEQKPE